MKTIDKKISIITNYGCNFNCPYCIWKGEGQEHKLISIPTTVEGFDWNKLEGMLSIYTLDYISLSGGGDPLAYLEENRPFLDKVFELTKKYNKTVHIHTRNKTKDDSILKNLSQIVLSYDHISYLRKYAIWLHENYPNLSIRLSKVATNYDYDYNADVEFAKSIGAEITFFPLGKETDPTDEKYIKFRETLDKHATFLEHGDYNYYFMPDNKVYLNYRAADIYDLEGLDNGLQTTGI